MASHSADVMDGISVIDADTHLTEPHDLWTSRAPKEWVDRVPQVREVKGRTMWTIDGKAFGNAVGAAVILPDGSKTFGTGFMQLGIDEVHAGASAVAPRLAMMDTLGIYAQIVYPNVVGIRWPAVRRRRRPDAQVALRDDLQRRDGGVPGGVRRSHVPDGDPAVVGPRRRGRRGGAGPLARAARASTPTPIRRTRASPTSAIGTGTRCGRRAPTSPCR